VPGPVLRKNRIRPVRVVTSRPKRPAERPRGGRRQLQVGSPPLAAGERARKGHSSAFTVPCPYLFDPAVPAPSGHLLEPIVVMKPTEDGNLHDMGALGESMRIRLRLDRVTDRLRDPWPEAGVGSSGVVVGHILLIGARL